MLGWKILLACEYSSYTEVVLKVFKGEEENPEEYASRQWQKTRCLVMHRRR